MKYVSFVIALVLTSHIAFGHNGKVHQYESCQAYELLKMNLGRDVPRMVNRVYANGVGVAELAPWQAGSIDRGAYREDSEDPVWGYSNSNPAPCYGDPALNVRAVASTIVDWLTPYDIFVTSTHFWNADKGDNQPTVMHCSVPGSEFWMVAPNSYQKVQVYLNGGFDININMCVYNLPLYSDGTGSCANQRAVVTVRYNSLVDLYANQNIYLTKVAWMNGPATVYNNPVKFTRNMWSSLNTYSYDDFIDNITWEALGRVCHLLQDCSVPAHVHVDDHSPLSRGDSFEGFMDQCYGDWTPLLINNTSGGFIDPYVSSNPIHHLMYPVAQIADHFGSNGPYDSQGNDLIGGDVLPWEAAYLNSLPMSSLGAPIDQCDFTYDLLFNIRDKTEPYTIRSTAGFLYWFATETGLLTKASVVTNFDGGNLTVDGKSVRSGYAKGFVNLGTVMTVVAPTIQSTGYHRYVFTGWQQLDVNGNIVASSSNPTWSVPINGKCTFRANYIDPLNVVITGPANLNYGQTATFTANAVGGAYYYNYSWWIQYPGAGGDLYAMANSPSSGSTATGGDIIPNLPPPDGTWYPIGTNSPSIDRTGTQTFNLRCEVTDAAQTVFAAEHYCYVATGGPGDPHGSVAGKGSVRLAEGESQRLVPEASSLNPAYPNPFNPSTTLSFALKDGAEVTLAIYDALGREVSVLAKGKHEAGFYRYSWSGQSAPSGIYFARLTASTGVAATSFSKLTKLLLVK